MEPKKFDRTDTRAERFTRIAIILHWLIAVGIVSNILLAWAWPFLSDDGFASLLTVHKSIGITILGLACMRLLWRMTHNPPASPSEYQRWELIASHLTHGLLYAIMFVMPLSGWVIDSAWDQAANHPMHYFFTFEWPRIAVISALAPDIKADIFRYSMLAHDYTSYLLYFLLTLHICGALKHQLLDGERELQRMWFR